MSKDREDNIMTIKDKDKENQRVCEILLGKRETKFLEFFINNPNYEFYQSKIALELHLSIATVQRFLKRLSEIEFVLIRYTPSKTFYKLNKNFKPLGALRALLKK